MENIKVEIKKPLYGNYVYINGAVVEKAIRLGLKLEIKIPNGTAIIDPNDWKKNGKIMKKVFKFVNNPMILYEGMVPLPYKYKGKIVNSIKEKIEDKQAKLF